MAEDAKVITTPARSDSDAERVTHGARLASPLPLVGRLEELTTLRGVFEPSGGSRAVHLVSGESGVGKSRLIGTLAAEARERGWLVVEGRAFAVESGVPYALLADAFQPLLRDMEPSALTVLTRGGERDLQHLFPTLGPATGRAGSAGLEPEEHKTRLLWSFHQLLDGLSARQPLMVVLDDMQWADESSLEALHFVARQPSRGRFALVGSYNTTEVVVSAPVRVAERSLVDLGVATTTRVEPLSSEDSLELLMRTFGLEDGALREFSALLFGWTRGNVFFIEEVLKGLVQSGRLRHENGTWVGWDVREPALPPSVRDAVMARLQSLEARALELARLLAVLGLRASLGTLEAVSSLDPQALLDALSELRLKGLLAETSQDGRVLVDFVHPIVRRTLYEDLGLARTHVLHGDLALALERHYGDDALPHAGELAYHFERSQGRTPASKALLYLREAGRQALERRGDREASGYLQSALSLATADASKADPAGIRSIRTDLARARSRLGRYEEAIGSWEAILADTPSERASERADALRALALITFWSGDHARALDHLEEAAAEAERSGEVTVLARVLVARGYCHQETGHGARALEDLEAAVSIAASSGDLALQARAQRALALLHVWISAPDVARSHLGTALDLAERADLRADAFWARWGLASVEGLTGDVPEMDRQTEHARDQAEALRSPTFRLLVDEIVIERAFAVGDWDTGIALGDKATARARTLNQRTLLPRLLVLTAMFHFGRGDAERGKALVDEASALVGLDGPDGSENVHSVVAAHIGLAAHHLAVQDYAEAIRIGERGLAIADRTGFSLWALHRLLPILVEAYVWVGDLGAAESLGNRMRDLGARLRHRLADAWADACSSILLWKRGDSAAAAVKMRAAAETLEEIPMLPAATRLRRQLAGRLAETGEREAALAELRHVHDVFVSLGAERELELTRRMFAEIGSRPPPIRLTGEAPLTPRELEVARLVARGRSNKAAGRELGISTRTVSTHLSNIYQKMGLSSRMELAEFLRQGGLLAD